MTADLALELAGGSSSGQGPVGQTPAGAPAAQIVTSIKPANKLTLAEVQAKLAGKSGKRYWKHLDELADTPEFQEMVREEFPRQAGAGEWVDAVSRRGFLKVMGASFAMAGLAGCTKQPDEPIFPYVKQPEDLVLGNPMYFATAHPFPTGAVPLLVKSEAFRPIKIDGNPEHPVSKGKTDAITQATLLDLYDPDRSQFPLWRGNKSDWSTFQAEFSSAVDATRDGTGVWFLSETVTSPTLAAQWKQVQAKYPKATLVQYDPVNGDTARAVSQAAFGEYVDAQYKLEDADVILALEADFLSGNAFPGFLPMAAAYAERHRYEAGKPMNRLYVVESMPTVTGFKAEHRLGLKPSELENFVHLLADVAGLGSSANEANYDGNRLEEVRAFAKAVSADLKASGGKCVVIAGPQSPASAQALAHQLNAALGSVGKTVIYTEPVAAIPSDHVAGLKALVAAINAGQVKWLVTLGANPVYSAPADLGFKAAYYSVPNTVHLGSHVDETGELAAWHINQAHFLESWSDARACDGTITIVQPMIAPLYDGKTAHDVLQTLLDPSMSAYDAVVATAKTYIQGDFAKGWRKALHDGWVENTAFAAKTVTAKPGALPAPTVVGGTDLEIGFRPDPSLYDGRYANNGWLQELPKQVTNLAWDNAAIMSLNTMTRYSIDENDAIELELDGRKLIAPVLMAPGHPDNAITLHLGFGRQRAGRVGEGVGANAYLLRGSDAPLAASGVRLRKTGDKYDVCVTKVHNIEHRGKYAQHDLEFPHYDNEGTYSLAGHEAMERSIIRYATLAEVQRDADYTHHGTFDATGKETEHTVVNKVGYNPQGEAPGVEESFWPDAWRYDHVSVVGNEQRVLQNKWGMSIDLNSCIGCNACVVSCYAENNIPVVGREQVKIGRDMQWIRIDTYFEGDLHAPRAHFQPMLCQHCESAGCEQVCPVGATVHTPEGINTMVYNRCVGTRYCSNNCMYKVRRFNFLLYSYNGEDYDQESLKFMRNPDVSVRSRGVMEKCSYCIQRIERVKIAADKENRSIRDGEIVTACEQACPTGAIVFGNLNDPNARVTKRKAEERDYMVLADLNYRPRTSYTAGVINPNPELA